MEEMKFMLETYYKYFKAMSKLDEKVLTKEEIISLYEELDEIEKECIEITPRVAELLK